MNLAMSDPQGTRLLRVFLFVLALFLIHLILPRITDLYRGTPAYAIVGTLLWFGNYFLMYACVLIFLRWEKGGPVTQLGIETDNNTLLELVVGGLSGLIGVGLVVILAAMFGGQLRPSTEITADLVANQILYTIIAAYFEEIAHRGYLMPRMENLWGRKAGILVGSLLFSLLHFNWWIPLGTVANHLIVIFTFNIALGGVVLALGYYLSGRRLWVSIAFHYVWNLIGYIMFSPFPRVSVQSPELFQIEWGLTTIPGFLVGLLVMYLSLRILKREK